MVLYCNCTAVSETRSLSSQIAHYDALRNVEDAVAMLADAKMQRVREIC